MLEHLMHLSNCHGELQVLAGFATAVPVLGPFIQKCVHACGFGHKAHTEHAALEKCDHSCEDDTKVN